jgi:hypothetical protein
MGVKLGVTLNEEHKLRIFMKMVVRRMFGPKRRGGKGGWRIDTLKSRKIYTPHAALLKVR